MMLSIMLNLANNIMLVEALGCAENWRPGVLLRCLSCDGMPAPQDSMAAQPEHGHLSGMWKL